MSTHELPKRRRARTFKIRQLVPTDGNGHLAVVHWRCGEEPAAALYARVVMWALCDVTTVEPDHTDVERSEVVGMVIRNGDLRPASCLSGGLEDEYTSGVYYIACPATDAQLRELVGVADDAEVEEVL